MTLRHLVLTGVVVMTCVLPGCLSPGEVTPINRYVLEPALEATPLPEAPRATNTLGLRPLTVARPYGSRMAYREAGLSMGYYTNAQWAETPGPVLTRALEDGLRLQGAFSDVGNAADMARPDLILTGDIRKFYEDRGGDQPTAVLEAEVEVRRAQGVEALFTRIYAVSVPLEGDGPQALAAAMNQAVARFATDAARDIAAAASAPLDEDH